MKNKLYVINGKTYLSHINDEVHLYGLLHQLAFLAGRIKDEEDVFHVLDTAKRYGEIAEEKFQGWDIPGRYLVFGDPKDLKGLMDKELDEVEVVPEDEPKPKKYRDEYIIPGSGFRMLVGSLALLLTTDQFVLIAVLCVGMLLFATVDICLCGQCREDQCIDRAENHQTGKDAYCLLPAFPPAIL